MFLKQPPAKLSALAQRLRAVGGEVELIQISQDQWELHVDFPNAIQDEALGDLKDAPGVAAIRILKGEPSDKGLALLKNLPDLALLVVRSKRVTDKGLQEISRLTSLTKLDLLQARLTARGLEALARLTRLKELYLYGVDLRDGDVEPLKKLRHLGWLYLPATVSLAKYKELQRALPTTTVHRETT